MAGDIEDRLAATLQEQSFAAVFSSIGQYRKPEIAFRLLSEVAFCPAHSEEVEKLRASMSSTADKTLLDRTLLLLGAQHAIGKIAELPVADSVKKLIAT